MQNVRRLFLLAAALMAFAVPLAAQKALPYKLVLVTGRPLDNADLVKQIREVAKIAGENGMTGLVLDAYFDRITREAPYSYKNLLEIVAACNENGLEFIPAVMGMGYNAPMLGNDKHLIEGLPVRNAVFIAQGREASLVPDPTPVLVNGDFEKAAGNAPAGWTLGNSRASSLLDKSEKYAGNSSLKVTVKGEAEDDFAPVASQEIAVTPWRNYRVTVRVKTEGLESRGDVFPMLIQGPDGRRLQYYIPPLQATAGWTLARVAFNSRDYNKVRISVGAPGGGGTFWVDDYAIAEEGPINILRRAGTPLVVKGEKNGVIYTEGADHEPLYDPVMTLLYDHEPPVIKLTPNSRIAQGERLLVSYWNNHPIYHGQTPACFSEPAIYDWWRKDIEFIDKYIHPKTFYLGVDELRLAGTCETCKLSGLSLSEMLGRCVTRQMEIIRSINPDANILAWSDMFDPHHNVDYADKPRDYYYFNYDTFKNTWEYVP
ncbi:MAG: hypothetical protein AB1801_28710, partial [Chloroflexota bacterium]